MSFCFVPFFLLIRASGCGDGLPVVAFVLGCCLVGSGSRSGTSPYPTLLPLPSRSPRRPLASGGWLCGVEEDGGGLVPLGLYSFSRLLVSVLLSCQSCFFVRCGPLFYVFCFLTALLCLCLCKWGGSCWRGWVCMLRHASSLLLNCFVAERCDPVQSIRLSLALSCSSLVPSSCLSVLCFCRFV